MIQIILNPHYGYSIYYDFSYKSIIVTSCNGMLLRKYSFDQMKIFFNEYNSSLKNYIIYFYR